MKPPRTHIYLLLLSILMPWVMDKLAPCTTKQRRHLTQDSLSLKEEIGGAGRTGSPGTAPHPPGEPAREPGRKQGRSALAPAPSIRSRALFSASQLLR